MSLHPLDPHGSAPCELRDRLGAERRGWPFLVYRDRHDRQVIVELGGERERVVIGRRSASDVALVWDPEVSRMHAAIERIGRDWVLCDEGLSHNGTWVNGERLHGRRTLRDGDMVAVGDTRIAFCAPAAESSAEHTRTAAEAARPPAVTPAQRRVLLALCRPLEGRRVRRPGVQPRDRGRAHDHRRHGQGDALAPVRGLRPRGGAPESEARGARPARARERARAPRRALTAHGRGR